MLLSFPLNDISNPHSHFLVNKDTKKSFQSCHDSEDLNVGPVLKGNPSKENKQNDWDKVGGNEKKKPEKDKEKHKDKHKVKKGMLKSLGEMFR